ncbi:hypothetical protein R9X47_18110 [Wukongibacter baidiensis]|uniref:hypothetical protein n=1 Tax=Wukongibacter baidiensis TaxID=1723361 RepID=UPI003D7F6470
MMYYYWNTKGIRPSVLYNMPKGELLLIMAFYEEEMKEREKMMKSSMDESYF